jgi:L-amino acid N-acyltransferase YncA
MSRRPDTVLSPVKLDMLRKSLMTTPMSLHLSGMSMFPAIRAGDRCRVVAVDPETVGVGDIILATRDQRLFAHRVVAIEAGPPRRWIIKGDTMLWPDPPVTEDDLLGQVIGVERRGRVIDLRAPVRRKFGAVMSAVSEPYAKMFARAVVLRRRVLGKMADIPAWRARRRARGEPVSVHPATDADLDALAMLFGEQQALREPMAGIDMEALRYQARHMQQAAESAGATLWVAEHVGFVSGHAVIGPIREEGLDAPGWWVMSVYVKMTARGAGLAERMVTAGLDEARSRGAGEVRYAAFETNTPSLNLARKLGFVPDESDIARRFAAYYARTDASGARLIVVKKTL